MSITEALSALRDLIAPVRQITTDRYAVAEGYRIEDLEETLSVPRRKRGDRDFKSIGGLVAYVLRHKDEATCLYGFEGHIEAVLNDHAPEIPGHGDHRAILSLREHEKLEVWRKAEEGHLSQSELIDLIDENMGSIVQPDAADLAEMISTLKVNRNTNVESAKDLRSGKTRIVLTDQTEGSTATAEIPNRMMILVPVFECSEAFRAIEVKLSWALREHKIMFELKLLDLDDALDAERAEIDAKLKEAIGLEVWR